MKTRLSRFAALAVTGGFLLQIVGCSASLAPIFLSLAESAILSSLLGGLTTP
ncbi:MAG: hypothetical protein IID36_12485 [Planctomycetes bacterium]|nr:hypothetical protein [Planctomycetota bacterium]